VGSVVREAVLPAVPAAVDDARPIGAVAVQSEVTAMRVGYENDDHGEPVYLDETPIYVSTVWRFIDYGQRSPLRWWRLEVKTHRRNGVIAPGDMLVVAEHPYANGWLQGTPFKRGSKKGGIDRIALPEEVCESAEMVLAYLDRDAPQDFWETGNYITAGISEPSLPWSPSEKRRNVKIQGLFVFGSCKDFKIFENTLWVSEKVQQLFRATENGSIRYWAPKARIKARPELLREVREDAVNLMGLSIRQALAGPHEKSEKWIGREVADKVDQIYRGHLNNRNRVLARQGKGLTEIGEREFVSDTGLWAETGEEFVDFDDD
jgi:hypothetical protein